jgi:hypothetical protein
MSSYGSGALNTSRSFDVLRASVGNKIWTNLIRPWNVGTCDHASDAPWILPCARSTSSSGKKDYKLGGNITIEVPQESVFRNYFARGQGANYMRSPRVLA